MAVANDEVVRLTQELAATREYLQVVIEQQEAANEELQSANEEAQSANEEMQSVNEELETSKEEIQSSNEELATVNDELNSRNEELSRLNSSLQLARDYAESIVSSMRSPLVVLDAGSASKQRALRFTRLSKLIRQRPRAGSSTISAMGSGIYRGCAFCSKNCYREAGTSTTTRSITISRRSARELWSSMRSAWLRPLSASR